MRAPKNSEGKQEGDGAQFILFKVRAYFLDFPTHLPVTDILGCTKTNTKTKNKTNKYKKHNLY